MLLISGQWQSETDVFSLEYDLNTSAQSLLECDGLPAYKCTILGDQLLYARRSGEHFESRHVTTAAAASRRAVHSAVRREPGQVQPIATQPMGKCGCRGDQGILWGSSPFLNPSFSSSVPVSYRTSVNRFSGSYWYRKPSAALSSNPSSRTRLPRMSYMASPEGICGMMLSLGLAMVVTFYQVAVPRA